MLNKMKNEFNKTVTENEDLAYKSTQSKVLDLFALGGAYRGREKQDMINLFTKAYNEDKNLALKTLFYLRDIRGGQGERKYFRTILKYILEAKYPEQSKIELLLKYIPEYGRWDDLISIYGISEQIDDTIIAIMYTQLKEDISSKTPSLLGKWLPSENASSKQTKLKAKAIRTKLEFTSKVYREILTKLRKKIRIVESQMSSKQWDKIEYGKIPSKAGMIYRKAFYKHDKERYEEFINRASDTENKEVTINAGTLFPYEIFEKIANGNYDNTLEALWKNLPDYVKKDENTLVMADTSSSMWGQPIAVALSLALYFAERNKGKFANHFMTFSESPELQEIVGQNLQEKYKNMCNAHWGMNTDLNKAFMKILDIAVQNNVPREEMPSKLYIISDMQFDGCCTCNQSTFERARQSFNSEGYQLPEVIFWNVNARIDNVPVTINEMGVQLVSGCSPVIFQQIVSGLTAYDLMIKIITGDRYKPIQL